jgi:hypothetical protein
MVIDAFMIRILIQNHFFSQAILDIVHTLLILYTIDDLQCAILKKL